MICRYCQRLMAQHAIKKALYRCDFCNFNTNQEKAMSNTDPSPESMTRETAPAGNVFRHVYKPLTEQNKRDMNTIKDQAADLYATLTALGASRELSVAKTKLEEAVFWASKHITS